jgi:hypothetical protein
LGKREREGKEGKEERMHEGTHKQKIKRIKGKEKGERKA